MYYSKDYFEAIASDLRSQIEKNTEELAIYPAGTLRHDYCNSGHGRNRIFLASKQDNGKTMRKGINNQPDLLLKALRREYLSAQNTVLTRDVELLQTLVSEFTDTLPISYIEQMPKRFHTLPAGLVRLFATTEPSSILTGEQTIANPQALSKLASDWIPARARKQVALAKDLNRDSANEPKEKIKENVETTEIQGNADGKIYVATPDEFQGTSHLDFYIEDENDAWEYAEYEKSTYKLDCLTQPTNKGENVRSKSEAFIANTLLEYTVPYRYEQVLHIGQKKYAPDFTVRSRKTGKIFYWEHFGRVNDEEYMEKHWRKLKLYASVGLKLWDNLITTYDNANGSLDLPFIEAIIKCKLL